MIVGLMILVGLILYLLISLGLIGYAVHVARKRGSPGWKGGLLMAAIMYLILLWDWVPMRATHKYLCMTQGGFTLNKTLEDWQRENPGVAESLLANKTIDPITENHRKRYLLNQRFAWDIYTTQHLFGIRQRDERIVDLVTDAVLARYVDFDSNQNQHQPASFRDYKIWLYVESCEQGGNKINRGKFYNQKYMFKHQKELE